MRTAKTLIRLGGSQVDLRLRWAHSHFVGFVMLRLKYIIRCHFRWFSGVVTNEGEEFLVGVFDLSGQVSIHYSVCVWFLWAGQYTLLCDLSGEVGIPFSVCVWSHRAGQYTLLCLCFISLGRSVYVTLFVCDLSGQVSIPYSVCDLSGQVDIPFCLCVISLGRSVYLTLFVCTLSR